MSRPIYSVGDRWFGRVNAILLTIFALCALYPIVYVTSLSMSSGEAGSSGQVWLWPVEWTLAAHQHVVKNSLFWISYANTFFYTVTGTLTSLALVIPAAYALSKARLRGRRVIGFFIAFTMWFHAGMIPFYLNLRDLDLLDSRWGIVIAFALNAFNVILMRNFFESVSPTFEEAARIDGANDFQILWKVYIPLAKPAIATVALLCAIARWNGYFWSMVLLKTEDKIPLQVFLKKTVIEVNITESVAGAISQQPYSLETITGAIIVLSIIPVLIVYPMIQKYFTKGVTLGGIKE
ncbi:MAG: carbohydrate ABC transporter permease [Burkholderiales bacterium]|nr:carbohydrate ABC transporter permease [Burkholderiales bacterium]